MAILDRERSYYTVDSFRKTTLLRMLGLINADGTVDMKRGYEDMKRGYEETLENAVVCRQSVSADGAGGTDDDYQVCGWCEGNLPRESAFSCEGCGKAYCSVSAVELMDTMDKICVWCFNAAE